MAIYRPPPPPFMGGAQPHAPRKLPAVILNATFPPPPSFGGPIASIVEIVTIAQPNPWTYAFQGGLQPYAPRRLNPSIIEVPVNPPPPSFGGPIAGKVESASIAQPDPWTYAFQGGQQPYAPRRMFADGLAVVVSDPPAISSPGRLQIAAEITALWQPDLWTYTFMGGRQPLTHAPLNPAFEEGPPPPPPGSGAAVGTDTGHGPAHGHYPQPAYDAKPRPPFKPIWDRGGEVDAPKPAPFSATNPAPLPPAYIFDAQQPVSLPQGMPTFDDVVPPNHMGLDRQMKETRDLSDAIAVLKALGIITE